MEVLKIIGVALAYGAVILLLSMIIYTIVINEGRVKTLTELKKGEEVLFVRSGAMLTGRIVENTPDDRIILVSYGAQLIEVAYEEIIISK